MSLKYSEIIDAMMAKDYFSQWMEIERIDEGTGYCKLRMTVRKEMLNGFGICHGGITFSFADSALAFACNSRGQHAVSIEVSISHLHPVKEFDILTAEAKEVHLSNKLGVYEVKILNQDEVLVGLFKGTVYRKKTAWQK